MNKFGEWDWNYAEAYPLMKHRLGVLLSEGVRLNQTRPDLEKLGNLSYDDILCFIGLLTLIVSQFPRQFRDG